MRKSLEAQHIKSSRNADVCDVAMAGVGSSFHECPSMKHHRRRGGQHVRARKHQKKILTHKKKWRKKKKQRTLNDGKTKLPATLVRPLL